MSELSVGSLSGLAANSYVIDVASGSSLDLSNGATLPAGSIIAVKHALKTGTQATGGIAAGGNTIVTDLTLTHEVANASNKLIISAFLGAAANSDQAGQVGIAIHDGTSLIGVGDSADSRTLVGAGGRAVGTRDSQAVTMPSVTFVYAPGSGSKTYTVRAINIRPGTETLYINRDESDGDSAGSTRAVSSLVIQEVSV